MHFYKIKRVIIHWVDKVTVKEQVPTQGEGISEDRCRRCVIVYLDEAEAPIKDLAGLRTPFHLRAEKCGSTDGLLR